MKDLFDEIDQERKELPHLKNIQDVYDASKIKIDAS